jgi:DNA-binding NarL/FixJ family response regulator
MIEQHRDPSAGNIVRGDDDIIHISLGLNDEIPSHLRPILHALTLGVVDSAACRKLGLSPRTFSRRVAELLEHLGVESRFQAGMQVMLKQLQRGAIPATRADAVSRPGQREVGRR